MYLSVVASRPRIKGRSSLKWSIAPATVVEEKVDFTSITARTYSTGMAREWPCGEESGESSIQRMGDSSVS